MALNPYRVKSGLGVIVGYKSDADYLLETGSTPQRGDSYFNFTDLEYRVFDGTQFKPSKSVTRISVDYFNSAESVLPATGSPYSPDGTPIADGETILFSQIGVYRAHVVAGDVDFWELLNLLQRPDGTPEAGDKVYVRAGATYQNVEFTYDGTDWNAGGAGVSPGTFSGSILTWDGSQWSENPSLTVSGSAFSSASTIVLNSGQVIKLAAVHASDPSGSSAGDIYYNSTTNKFKYHNGTSWVDFSSDSSGGIAVADYKDDVTTVLPDIEPYSPDGTPIADGDVVLFTNLVPVSAIDPAVIVQTPNNRQIQIIQVTDWDSPDEITVFGESTELVPFNTDNDTSVADLAAAIETANPVSVDSAVATGDTITVTSNIGQILSFSLSQSGSQNISTDYQSETLIQITDWVSPVEITPIINGVPLSAVPFNTDNDTSVADLATEIATSVDVDSAIATGDTIAVLSAVAASTEYSFLQTGTRPAIGSDAFLKANVSSPDITWDLLVNGQDPLGQPVHGDAAYIKFGVATEPDSLWFRQAASWVQFQGGSGAGVVKARLHDPVSSTLPTSAPLTIDGELVVTDDLVLFSNLSSDPNRVYRATVTGPTVSWMAESLFSLSVDPSDGDLVIITEGTGFADQLGKFDGTDWTFNFKTRHFNGMDYWEESSLMSATIADNQSAPDNIFSIPYSGSENIIIEYSIQRGTTKEIGRLLIVTDGTNIDYTQDNAGLGSSGVELEAVLNGSDVELNYTSTNTGSSGTIKWIVRRWSDASGGPGGLPAYSAGGGEISGSGANTQIAVWSGANTLTGSSNLEFDTGTGVLSHGSVDTAPLQSVTAVDNTITPLISFAVATYRHAIIDYSVERNGSFRTGRLLFVTDGTSPSLSEDFTEVGSCGISFSAAISTGTATISGTLTNIGNDATFKFSMKSWI